MAVFEAHGLDSTDESLRANCGHSFFDSFIAAGEDGNSVLLGEEAVDVGDDFFVFVGGEQFVELAGRIDFLLEGADGIGVHAQVGELTFEAKVFFLQPAALGCTNEEALCSVEYCGREARDRSADQAHGLVDEADSALCSGVPLEKGEDDRYAEEDKEGDAILI